MKPEIDTFDTIDGKHVVYSCQNPDEKYSVVSLLDGKGDETDDPEKAAGGIIQLGEKCFTTFFWRTVQ